MTKTAEKAVSESLEKGEDPIITKDEDGKELHQRPFDLTEAPAKPKRSRARRRVRVISVVGAKMHLSDGETIMPHEEKLILESDYKLCGDKVRKLA